MIALYSRVSTEEQATNGYSIQAQKNELEQYANSNKLSFKHYSDEGYSGGTLKRPALQQLLKDIQLKKITQVVFVKLDRWFRSVPDYYEIQKILEDNNVTWRALQEEYETETSSGKFKVNIMLSVSQQFKDATSERIRSVFKYKMDNGYTVSPNVPKGFKTTRTDKGLIIEIENKDFVKDFINKADEYASLERARNYVNNKYDYDMSYHSASVLIHSPLIYGEFHGKQILDPIVPKEVALRIVDRMGRSYTNSKEKRTYIFKSLIVCPVCGGKLVGYVSTCNNLYKYQRYRCNRHVITHTCSYSTTISQNSLERHLVSNFEKFTKEYIIKLENQDNEPKIDKKKIEQKLSRLNDMYLEGRCTKEYFDSHYIELKEQLEYVAPNLENLKKVIEGKPMDIYNQMSEEEKGHFWRLIIKSIKKVDGEYQVEFL